MVRWPLREIFVFICCENHSLHVGKLLLRVNCMFQVQVHVHVRTYIHVHVHNVLTHNNYVENVWD